MKSGGVVLSILATLLIATAIVLAIVLVIYAAVPNQFATTFNQKMMDAMKVPSYTLNAEQLFPCKEMENQFSMWFNMAESAKSMAEKATIALKPIEKLTRKIDFKKEKGAGWKTPGYLQTIWKSYGTVKIQGKLEEGAFTEWMYLPDILLVAFLYVEEKTDFQAPNLPGTVTYLLPFDTESSPVDVFVKEEPKKVGTQFMTPKPEEKMERVQGKGFVVRTDTVMSLSKACSILAISFIPKKITGITSKFNASFAKMLNKFHRWKQVSSMSNKFWKQ